MAHTRAHIQHAIYTHSFGTVHMDDDGDDDDDDDAVVSLSQPCIAVFVGG